MADVLQQILTFFNNSKEGGQLPIANNVISGDTVIIYSNTNQRLEQITASNFVLNQSSNFITIGTNIFRFIKGYTGNTKNTSGTLETNDIISNSVIRNNNFSILIKSAVYNGGTVTDFGVYDQNTGDFTGGSYTILEYIEL